MRKRIILGNKRILRVFPRWTSMTPRDRYSYVGEPDLFVPDDFDEVQVSVCFTWDREYATELAWIWKQFSGKEVTIGGPAMSNCGIEFTPGLYLREGVTITSRGCPFNCEWCYVPKREGKIRELEIQPGNMIQDNNLLACSKKHVQKVFEMLKTQRAIQFNGGLDVRFITDGVVEDLRGLKINQIFVAYDSDDRRSEFVSAVRRLRKAFNRRKIRCYTLIGYEGDTVEAARERLLFTWIAGGRPYAMLYRNDDGVLYDAKEWKDLKALFSLPSKIKAICEHETGVKYDQ